MYSYDSRKIKPGDSFICLPGAEPYITEAKSRGASDVLPMSRQEMGDFANTLFNEPSKKLCVIGVTGTNGKTSICHFLHQALTLLGKKSYVQGTITHTLTTPESFDTHEAMRQHLESGGSHFIMEVSSHGIVQQRIAGITFSIKCLTNITGDHLDFHLTFEHYKQSKLSFIHDKSIPVITPSSILTMPHIENEHIFAEHNQKNLKMAYLILKHCKFNDAELTPVFSKLHNAPGRFEKVPSKAPFHVFVDYAHTEDGLKVVLESATQLKKNGSHLLCCFGCGGDRDKSKRPKMAKIASDYCDFIVLTQDNPRSEDPEAIMDDITKGLTHQNYMIEHDRKKAIQILIKQAKKDDILIIAGKGHENAQIIGKTRYPFNDKLIASDLLKDLGY
jgi:UDP-N-acetylmuramoyl-L-alanyl-D-glutamate--2,6-diaminopimelate ligase